jgi:hypothetical protein
MFPAIPRCLASHPKSAKKAKETRKPALMPVLDSYPVSGNFKRGRT